MQSGDAQIVVDEDSLVLPSEIGQEYYIGGSGGNTQRKEMAGHGSDKYNLNLYDIRGESSIGKEFFDDRDSPPPAFINIPSFNQSAFNPMGASNLTIAGPRVTNILTIV